MKTLHTLIAAFILMIVPAIAAAQLTGPQGGTGVTGIANGSIPFGGSSLLRLATSSAFQYNSSLSRLTVTNASTTNITVTEVCLSGSCRTSWPSGSGGTSGIATSGPIANTEIIYATAADTVDSESAFTYSAASDRLTVVNASTTNLSWSGVLNLWGTVWGALTDLRDYVWSTFTGGTGITFSSGTISFDCTEVEGTGINCSGSNITLDATGDWTGTVDGNNFTGGAVATGDLLYGSSAGNIAELTIGGTGNVLTVVAGVPAWLATSSLDLGPTGLLATDFGSFTCNGTTCSIDTGAVSNAMLANSSVSFGGVSVDLGASDATPAFNLVDATGLPISTGVSGLGTGVATWLATPSSANLASAVTGETGSGALVFGTDPSIDAGGGVIEIPNGTASVVDAIGEIAFDTTDNQLLVATSTVAGAPGVIPLTQSLGSFLISSTTQPFTSGFTTGGTIPFKVHRDGYTVTELWCDIDGGTSIVVNFDNGSGNTSTVTCDTDGASLTGINGNNVVAAGSVSASIETGTVTGSPNYLRVSVFGTYTRE